jgi:hypothetical protein
MALRRPKADSSTDQTIPIPRDENGCTPPLYGDGKARNFGTKDGDADRRPTLLTPDGRVTSGDPK